MSWVPRAEIVEMLVESGSGQTCTQVLASRLYDILYDCNEALVGVEGELADQCRHAIETLAGGFTASAQSHAANIIKSIMGQWPKAKKLTGQGAQHDGLQGGYFFSEYVTFLPLPKAFRSGAHESKYYPRPLFP